MASDERRPKPLTGNETMNTLKAKMTIECETCGCKMNRVKSIRVTAETKEAAMAEAKQKAADWAKSLSGKSCKVCSSILAAVGA